MPLIMRTLVPFAFAYLVANLVRVVNAVAGGPISEDLGLNAADLGLLTSVYFIGFAAAQLPFGILMDRYGPRLVEATTLLIAVAGCLIFALAPSLLALAQGRFLNGVGSAVGLKAPLAAERHASSRKPSTCQHSWFSPSPPASATTPLRPPSPNSPKTLAPSSAPARFGASCPWFARPTSHCCRS